MDSSNDNAEIADHFATIAKQFCDIVDSASNLGRAQFLSRIYPMLPKLIDSSISLPDVEIDDADAELRDPPDFKEAARQRHPEWQCRYTQLIEVLGDWDCYQVVFNSVKDRESIVGSLADDLADIYGDLNESLIGREARFVSHEEQIWNWRFLFSYHWGKHAVDALSAIYWRLERNEP